MDFSVIIVIVAIVWALSSVANRAKTMNQAKKPPSDAKANEQAAKPKAKQSISAPKQNADRLRVAQPAAYQTIQSRMVDPNRDEEYVGSLAAESTEGIDPCHDEEMQRAYAINRPYQTEASALGVAGMFGRDALVKAVVMSEILTRPSQRKWGRR